MPGVQLQAHSNTQDTKGERALELSSGVQSQPGHHNEMLSIKTEKRNHRYWSEDEARRQWLNFCLVCVRTKVPSHSATKKKKLEKDLLVVSYLICITTRTQSFLKDINIYRIVAYCMLVKTSEGPEV